MTEHPTVMADEHPMSAVVEETPDFWIVRDCIAAKEGLLRGPNGSEFLPREEIAASWEYWEGVPLLPFHPPGPPPWNIVPLLPLTLGRARNVRIRADDGAILYDAHLLRRADVPGMRTRPVIVEHNAGLVAALRKGERLDNSAGTSGLKDPTPGTFQGRAYTEVRRGIMPVHIAIFPPGVRGNCGWQDGCGVARAAADILHSQGMAPPSGWVAHKTSPEDKSMANPNDPPAAGGTPATPATPGVVVVHADAAKMQALEGELAKLRERVAKADQLEEANKKLTTDLTAVTAKVDEIHKAFGSQETARLTGKRALLARARGVSADEFKDYPENVLDREIDLETKRRAKGDGLRLQGKPAANADDKDPFVAMPDGGFMMKPIAAAKGA